MKSIPFFLLLALCSTLALVSPSARAVDLAQEIHQTEQKIEQLGKLEDTATNKQIKEIYQQILTVQQEQAGYLEKIKTLSQQLKEHSTRTREVKQSIEQESLPQATPSFADKALPDLDRLMENAAAEKMALQNQLDETQNRLAQLQARLVPAQVELAEAKKYLGLAAKENKVPFSSLDSSLANALLLKQRKTNDARMAQVQALDLELLTIPNQVELVNLKKDWLNQKLSNLNAYLGKLQGQIRQSREAESASILDESLKLRKDTEEDPALQWLAQENVNLGNQLAGFVETNQAISDRRLAVEHMTKLIEDRHNLLQQQLNLGGETEGIGELMRKTLMQLMSVGQENTARTIADVQKAQIQSLNLERQKAEIGDKANFVQSIVERFPKSQLSITNNEERERLTSLLDLRLNLITKLLERNQQTLKHWGLLLNTQHQFNDEIGDFDKLLMENLLWTATNRPMALDWIKELIGGIEWIEPSEIWKSLSAVLDRHGGLLAGLSIGFAGLIYFLKFHLHPKFKCWQLNANEAVGNVRTDLFRNSLYMLGGEFFFSLAVPLFLLALRKTLGRFGDEEIWVQLLVEALKPAAIATLLLGLIRRLARPDGFLQRQLRWPASATNTLYKALSQRWLLIVLSSYVYIAETQSHHLVRYEFGRLPFLAFCLLSGTILRNLVKKSRPANNDKPKSAWEFNQLPYVFGNLFALGEFGLAGMEIFGFHLGAFVLQGSLVRTMGWTLVVVLLYQIIERWLLLEEHRMAYAHAQAIRTERRASGGEEEFSDEVTWENQRKQFAEIQTISLQSQTLIRLLSGVSLLIGLGWIWSDMIPALHLLDQVELWETTVSGNGGNIEAVTLKSLALALTVLGLMVLASRYLPGLLQLLVLQHMKLAPGTGFAATTLLKYLIFIAGLISICRLLGVQWTDLQWLVAALTVGLGFGLQEIFANFISGIIILFERPVRIGDIVTLNNGVTGTIDAINTRATTLTDWDNKEIIIPNKSLITEQLTNWSLSSLIIRLIVPVGIAYGSDTELAYNLLMQAAGEHPLVLKKPDKAVYFRGFGASSLDFELRCFVANPSARVGVIHDLNMRIDKLFREHGVEIAFPQMDVHIKRDHPKD